MPYIDKQTRAFLTLRNGDHIDAKTPGELNFQITELVWWYFQQNGNYQAINDVIGALEGAKLEFYRRVAANYEDVKKETNGEVYE